MQQNNKKEGKYIPPNHDEEDSDEEEEEVVVKKKKQKKAKKNKNKNNEDEDEEDTDKQYIHPDDKYNMKKALHPTAVLFTFAFKAGASLIYLFGSTILQDKLIFISVVLLMSFDFWTVKNITGRLLVGLRWWSDYDEEGNEVWRFECQDHRKFEANIVDKSFFWTSQLAITIFWIVFLALNVISFGFYWGILDFIGFTLSSVNLFGFYKCSGEQQAQVKDMRNKLLKKGVISMIS